jgi:hypothetical protein
LFFFLGLVIYLVSVINNKKLIKKKQNNNKTKQNKKKMWFLLEMFARLEYFILNCTEYTPSPVGKVMVVLCYIPMYTYIFFFIVTYYERTLYHFFLWNGLFFNGIAMVLLGMILPNSRNNHATCASRLTDKPCTESSIVCCVSAYLLLSVSVSRGEHVNAKDWSYRITMYLCGVCIYISSTIISLLYLKLFNWEEIILGAAVGLLSGVVTALLACYWIYPRFYQPRVQYMLNFFRIGNLEFFYIVPPRQVQKN